MNKGGPKYLKKKYEGFVMKSPEDQLLKNLSQNAEATFYKGFNSKHDLRSILNYRTRKTGATCFFDGHNSQPQ